MREIVVDTCARVPLRHPYHATDERLQDDTASELISNRNLGQQGSQHGIGVQSGSRYNIVERAAPGQRFVPIHPVCRRCPVITNELVPLSIEPIDDAESSPPERCARHRDDLVRRVLSNVLVETLLVLPIWASCCH
jgi:hypothetical protein